MTTRDKARELLGKRSLIFSLSQGQEARHDPDLFRRLVELAAEYGATHIHVGMLPYRHGSWVLPDNTDPYAAWCNCSSSLLRVCPPRELQPWVSADHAKWCQDVIRSQLDVMRPYGLKATCFAVEPLWLPEGVYRAHPRWRGAQCELGRIAMGPYFTPSIDEPEVLDLYRRAAKEFSTLFPEVDSFSFLSNDSGGGVAWTPNIYPGMNGPVRYRTRDGGERISGFLKALQDGSAEAGAKVMYNLGSSGYPPELTASARHKLRSGLFVRGGNDLGENPGGPGAHLGGGVWSVPYPAIGLGDPGAFLAGLQSVYHNPSGDSLRASIGIGVYDLDLARTLLETYLETPGPGLDNLTRLKLRAAEKMCGSAQFAERLVHVWGSVASAQHAIAQVRQKGFGLVLPFGLVSMRWLVRPLVPQPHLLTDAETAHYVKMVFAAGEQKKNPSFSMVLGKAVFRGESVMWMTRWCLQEAISTLHGARGTLGDIRGKLSDAAAAERIGLYAARVGALACLATTARNCVMYQYALDVADQPLFGPNPMDYDDNIIYDQRALTFRKIAREELDNINELIEIVSSQKGQVLEHARMPEEESVFMLSPDIVADLKCKADIMMDHWNDYEVLYPATKVFDLEPRIQGNILPEARPGQE